MFTTPLADQVRTYLDLQTFLDECRADGSDAGRTALEAEQARQDLLEELSRPQRPPVQPLVDATRAYVEAERKFEQCSSTGTDLDAPARRMERARRDLERQLRECADSDVRHVPVRPVQPPPLPSRERRILIAVDEGEPARWALEVGTRMALEAAAKVLLVHVVRPASAAAGEFVSTLESLDTLHHREADDMLDQLGKTLPVSIDVERMVREGTPAVEILTAAKVWGADVIVMGTRGRGRLAQFLLGSTAETVIRQAACPVVAVGRRAAWAAEQRRARNPRETAAIAT